MDCPTERSTFPKHGTASSASGSSTLVDSAESADIALGTVSCCFPTKRNIALSVIDEVLADAAPAFSDTECDLTYLDALERWLRRVVGGMNIETRTPCWSSIRAEPWFGHWRARKFNQV